VALDALLSRLHLPEELAAELREEIADREELERRLGEATEQLAAIFAHSPLVLFVVDSQYRVRRMSRGAEQFVGVPDRTGLGGSAGEVLRCIHRLDHPDGCGHGESCRLCPLRHAVLQTLRTGVPQTGVETVLSSDRQGDRPMRLSTTPTTQDGEPMVLLCMEDLSDFQAATRTAADVVREIPSGLFVYQYCPPASLTLQSANPAAERLTGLVAASALGREFDAIWPEARSRGLTDALLEVARTGRPFEAPAFEYRDERTAGAFLIRAFALPRNRVAVAFENVTRYEKAEEALRDSEARHRALFESGGEAVGLLDVDYRWVACNWQLLQMMGRSLEQQLGRTPFESLPPQQEAGPATRETVRRALEAALEGKRREIDVEVRRADGSPVMVEATVNRLVLGGTPFIQVTARDVTERWRAQLQVRESEARLRALIESTKSLILVLDERLRLQAFNSAFARHMREAHGVTAHIGMDVAAPLSPEHRARWAEWNRRVLAGEAVEGVFVEPVRGQERRFGFSMNPIVESGRVIGVSRFMRDITERTEAAVRLRSVTRRLFVAQEEERQRLSRELHDELGQVLTAVKIGLQRLQRAGEVSAAVRTRLGTSVEHVDQAISEVRKICLDLRPPLLDELGLEASLRALYEAGATAAGLKLHLTLRGLGDRPPPAVTIGLFRVAQEALTNALRYAAARSIWLETGVDEGGIYLIVRDDGEGFDLERIEQRTRSGRSMGLANMRERVGLLGGRLEIRSEAGVGTQITAWVPLQPQDADTFSET